MDRDRRLTGFLRGQTDTPTAPLGFELNNPWRVCFPAIMGGLRTDGGLAGRVSDRLGSGSINCTYISRWIIWSLQWNVFFLRGTSPPDGALGPEISLGNLQAYKVEFVSPVPSCLSSSIISVWVTQPWVGRSRNESSQTYPVASNRYCYSTVAIIF